MVLLPTLGSKVLTKKEEYGVIWAVRIAAYFEVPLSSRGVPPLAHSKDLLSLAFYLSHSLAEQLLCQNPTTISEFHGLQDAVVTPFLSEIPVESGLHDFKGLRLILLAICLQPFGIKLL